MDKFNRRPSARERRQKWVLYLLAFLVPALGFFVLFAFKNDGAPWVIGLVLVGAALAGWARRGELMRHNRMWVAGLPVLSPQGPGFSPLETAAISNLLAQSGTEAAAFRAYLAGSEVIARYHSGHGAVTTLSSDRPRPFAKDFLDPVFFFKVDELRSVVGCQFWSGDDDATLVVEFFTGGENTSKLDWTRVSFSEAPPDAQRPAVPMTPPIVFEPQWVHFRLEH